MLAFGAAQRLLGGPALAFQQVCSHRQLQGVGDVAGWGDALIEAAPNG
jgi:hypothetical protein